MIGRKERVYFHILPITTTLCCGNNITIITIINLFSYAEVSSNAGAFVYVQ